MKYGSCLAGWQRPFLRQFQCPSWLCDCFISYLGVFWSDKVSSEASGALNRSSTSMKRTPAQTGTKIWLTSRKTRLVMRPWARRMIPWEVTGRLLLFFHPGSFTGKATKFDLRTLILFTWGRKWGAESGEEQSRFKHNRKPSAFPLPGSAATPHAQESFSHRLVFF